MMKTIKNNLVTLQLIASIPIDRMQFVGTEDHGKSLGEFHYNRMI